jgi:hypothetical protein
MLAGSDRRLRAGDEDLGQAKFAVWLSKPDDCWTNHGVPPS